MINFQINKSSKKSKADLTKLKMGVITGNKEMFLT